MRGSHLISLACVASLAAAPGAAAEAWTLRSHDGQDGKTCSLSTVDRGRALAITVSPVAPAADQGIVGIAFKDPTVVRAGTKTLATFELDNGTRGDHRLEAMADGSSLIPIVTANVQDVLQHFAESRQLRVTTRVGTTSFSLDGIADHIPALRRCASR
jgi:hypothetical protein